MRPGRGPRQRERLLNSSGAGARARRNPQDRKYRLRFRQTPHVPHNWEASLLFEEVTHRLLCSDLFTQEGDVEPLTESDVVDRAKRGLIEGQKGPSPTLTPTRR